MQLPLIARVAQEHNLELRRKAAAWRAARPLADTPAPTCDDPVTIRYARTIDIACVDRLAALDAHGVRSGPVLLGFVGQKAVAALSLDTGRTIADPSQPTDEIMALLAVRARQLKRRSHPHFPSRFTPRRRKRRVATSK